MASFHAKIGWKWQRKGENKNCSSVLFPPEEKQKIPKNSKKIKKLKNTFMASFHAKRGRKILRNRENKNYRSVSFLPDA